MITTQDLRYELMINMETGERFKRALSKEEIFDLVDNKYNDDQAEEKLIAFQEAGLTLFEIFELALSRGGR